MPPFKTTALPPPGATFTVREIARHAECTIRTVRNYIQVKVVPAPQFRSSKTRYDRAFLVRLRAAMTLRRRGLHVRGVLETLSATPPEELFRLAGYEVPMEEVETVLATLAPSQPPAGAPSPADARDAARAHPPPARAPQPTSPDPAAPVPLAATTVPVRPLPPGFLGRYRPSAALPHERWDTFEICPGVKLTVRADPDPEASRVAQEILTLFGPQA